jgi:hypothetical protein
MTTRFHFFLRRFFILSTLCSTTAFASEWQQQTVPMVGVTNYMREACIKFTAGDVVQYRFESEHEVNFDIHYHPEGSTQFKERKNAVTKTTGEFSSEKTQPYCFTWKNKRELDKEWNITLHYLVVSK